MKNEDKRRIDHCVLYNGNMEKKEGKQLGKPFEEVRRAYDVTEKK